MGMDLRGQAVGRFLTEGSANGGTTSTTRPAQPNARYRELLFEAADRSCTRWSLGYSRPALEDPIPHCVRSPTAQE